MKRLLFNDALVAVIMLCLIITNYDARDMARGTPGFINRSAAGALDFLAAWFFFSAGTLLYCTLSGRPVSRWGFALLTLPLLLYIVATVIYTFGANTAKSDIVIYSGLYILLLKRAWMRPKDIGADDDQ